MRNLSTGILLLPMVSITIVSVCPSSLRGDGLNDTFSAATVLSPGVLMVSDDLSPTIYPDTLIGARDLFGGISVYNDDDSPLGDGTASGLFGIPINSGEIRFKVSGFDDFAFTGNHNEFGMYEVFVVAYNFFDEPVDSFSEIRTLQPGAADSFSFSDNSEYIGGTYDAYIDNTLGGVPGDIDFFTFTGLTPGAAFTAETVDPNLFEIDTLLGWFDSGGNLIASDDDSASNGALSLLQGIVPNEGTLTFAVTGTSDDDFVGNHVEDAIYELKLSLGTAGDFDGDGDVDGHDFLIWQRDPGIGNLADWQTNYGQAAGPSSALDSTAVAVPEPASVYLLAIAAALCLCRKVR